LSPPAFADRLAASVEARRSQVCLGLDPDPPPADSETARAAEAVRGCRELIARAGPASVAAKPQLACFERLGPAGWEALDAVVDEARDAGLLVIADGKRGDVPHTAALYAEALFTRRPGGGRGPRADAATVSPFLGGDSLEPFVDSAAAAGAGVFALVRTSNPGAADLLDLPAPDAPLYERIARLVAERAPRLLGTCGLSGMGAVVGGTEPRHLGRLRELMPESIFLVPGVGAQGGLTADLGPGLAAHPASLLVPASRSISEATDPAAAAEGLRSELWALVGG
jgi:orotidine-5'-phosphate decarboxylase